MISSHDLERRGNESTVDFALVLALASGFLGAGFVADDDVVIVEASDFEFHPESVTVRAGTTVLWVNKERTGEYHSV